jgi:hypothetical protein
MEEECFTPKQNILENKGGYQFGFWTRFVQFEAKKPIHGIQQFFLLRFAKTTFEKKIEKFHNLPL